jgi:hypothetical protein
MSRLIWVVAGLALLPANRGLPRNKPFPAAPVAK